MDGSWNSFGHVALATTGQGLQSVGNGTNAGNNYSHTSVTDYLSSQSLVRNTNLVVLHTNAEQEAKINNYLDSLADKKPDKFGDNCAVRTSNALKEAGLGFHTSHTPAAVYNQARARSESESHMQKGEASKAGAYSSFNPTPQTPGVNGALVRPLGSNTEVFREWK
jgi:hypothetical protein